MYRVIRGRDTGKTKDLLKKCSETGGMFICKHPERQLYKCESYGINPNNIKFMGYKDSFSVDILHGENIYIDELEEFVNYVLGNQLSGYTVTTED